jgi:hypothetical protein
MPDYTLDDLVLQGYFTKNANVYTSITKTNITISTDDNWIVAIGQTMVVTFSTEINFDPNSSITNNGIIKIQGGSISFAIDASITNNIDSIFINTGLINGSGFTDVNLINDGLIINTRIGIMSSLGIINRGNIRNSATMVCRLANENTVQNNGGLILYNNSSNQNIDARIENKGSITIPIFESFNNNGTLLNQGYVEINGTLFLYNNASDTSAFINDYTGAEMYYQGNPKPIIVFKKTGSIHKSSADNSLVLKAYSIARNYNTTALPANVLVIKPYSIFEQ